MKKVKDKKICLCLPLLFGAILACTNDEEVNKVPENKKITINDLQKTWCGAYEGWDSLMNVKTGIQKQLELNADGTYTNFIGGKLFIPNSKEGPFESEGGTYTLALMDSVCEINFTVKFDSLVDFGTQKMIGYNKKHYHTSSGDEYELESYTQRFNIINGDKGSFQLSGNDSTLFDLEGNGKPVTYELRIKTNEP